MIIRVIFVLGVLLLSKVVGAVTYTVNLAHISNPDGRPYIEEVRNLRAALSENTGDLPITRDDPIHSIITFANLDENGTTANSIDLVVRNSDLYVLGFIRGSQNNRTLYRFNDFDEQELNDNLPSSVRQTIRNTRSLGFNSSYPSIENVAGIGRYHNNLIISLGGLRSAVWRLSDFSGTPTASTRPALAQDLLQLLIAYFEGARFEEIATNISTGLNSSVGEAHITQSDAVLTNSWAHLSGFYVGATRNNNRRASYDLNFRGNQLAQRLSQQNIALDQNAIDRSFTSSLGQIGRAIPIAMTLGIILRSSCPNLSNNRGKREIAEQTCSTQEKKCIFSQDEQLPIGIKNPRLCLPLKSAFFPLGNHYFDREIGQAILAVTTSDKE